MKIEQTQCSETFETPVNHPEKSSDIPSALRAMAKNFTISSRHKSFKEHPCNRGKNTNKKYTIPVLSKVYEAGILLLVFALSTDP
jgi:hypothetical protein